MGFQQLRYSVISDGYKVENVDCSQFISECKAECCRLPIMLTLEEVEEGRIEYEKDRPYFVPKDSEGMCIYNKNNSCKLHPNSPAHCRGYKCNRFDK